MKCTLVLALTGSLILAAPAATPPAPSKPAPPPKPPAASKPARDGGRFLFVVDTSSSMRAIDPATRQAVFDLIFSGIDGYMRDGDTFGVWTFDEEVGTGKFPMQVWNSEKPLEGASRAATFVRGQEYKGDNRMEELMQKLTAVIRAVSNVNVFFITDGEAVLQGTPVDDAVNGAFAQRARERKAARKPFVTTLVAQAGKIVRGAVTLPGETIPLPPRPEPQKRAEKTVTPAATNALTTRGAATGPIPDTATAKTNQDASPAHANKPPSGVTAGTDAPSNATPAAPAVIPSLKPPPNHAESRGEATASSLAGVTVTAAPAESALANDASTTVPPAAEAPAKPRKVMQIITKPAPRTEPEPAAEIVTTAETNAAPQKVAALVTPPVTSAASTPVAPPPPASPAPVANLPAEPSAAASPATEPTEPAVDSDPKTLIVLAREPAPATASRNGATPTGLAAMRVEPGLGAIPTLIIGGILLAMSLFLLGIALRRVRPGGQGSLITQSMHRR